MTSLSDPSIDTPIDWSRYPKLAKIFEHRPEENVYWIELRKLIADQRAEAIQSLLQRTPWP